MKRSINCKCQGVSGSCSAKICFYQMTRLSNQKLTTFLRDNYVVRAVRKVDLRFYFLRPFFICDEVAKCGTMVNGWNSAVKQKNIEHRFTDLNKKTEIFFLLLNIHASLGQQYAHYGSSLLPWYDSLGKQCLYLPSEWHLFESCVPWIPYIPCSSGKNQIRSNLKQS